MSQRRSTACSSVGRSSVEAGQGLQRLFKAHDSFPVGRPGERLSPPAGIQQGLVPHLPLQGMVGQAVDLLVLPVAGQRFERLHNLGMQGSAPPREQTAVGHLVGEGMLEGVDCSGTSWVS